MKIICSWSPTFSTVNTSKFYHYLHKINFYNISIKRYSQICENILTKQQIFSAGGWNVISEFFLLLRLSFRNSSWTNQFVYLEHYRLALEQSPTQSSHLKMSTNSLLVSQVPRTHHTHTRTLKTHAYSQAHTHTKVVIQIQQECAIASPHSPQGVLSPLEPKWLHQSPSKPSFLAATTDDCTWQHVIICH